MRMIIVRGGTSSRTCGEEGMFIVVLIWFVWFGLVCGGGFKLQWKIKRERECEVCFCVELSNV
jgi:hypothetical protein